MRDSVLLVIAEAIQRASEGVIFDLKQGAACPGCGEKARVHVTRSWVGETKLRYHRCDNPDCPLSVIGTTIKSVQINNQEGKISGKRS
jgi:hypothetical protein